MILVNPLPSPINPEPVAATKFPPVTNIEPVTLKLPAILADVFTLNPLFGDIIASNEPEFILLNSKSSKDSAGILNNPLPSPTNRDADTGTLTNRLLLIIAVDEPD